MKEKTLIRMIGVKKTFGHVKALDGIDLTLGYNEILGIVGDNAAGKSTLLKSLAGVHRIDDGEIQIEDKKVEIKSPRDVRQIGIETIYQDFMLAPNLNIIKNIYLGRELTTWGFIKKLRKKQMANEVKSVLKDLGFRGSVNTNVFELSGGQQQTIAIARAILKPPKVILMDEPTASLSVGAIENFLKLVKDLKSTGSSIVYVSHRLMDVLEISDRIIVLRTGKKIAEKKKKETSLDEIVYLMMGKRNEENG